MVLFNFFHLMPWPHLEQDPGRWPIPNRLFDPARGPALYRQYLDQMQLAEDLGFDWIGCNEHHYSPFGLMASPGLVAAALSQRTRRVKLAILGYLLPLHNPLRVAEEYAMLDNLSGGRLIAGFLRGTPHEALAYDTNPDDSRDRFEEAVELILKCWTEPEPFGWEGRYFQYRAVSIWPRPVQRPHPRLFTSASGDRGVRFAVKHRMGVGSVTPIQRTAQVFDLYRRVAAEQGWTPPPETFLQSCFIHVQPTRQAARTAVEEPLRYMREWLTGPAVPWLKVVMDQTQYAEAGEREARQQAGRTLLSAAPPSLDEQIEHGNLAVGTPEDVVAQITRIVQVTGAGVINASLHRANMPAEQVEASMRLFMHEVYPHVRHLGVQAPAAAAETTATPAAVA